MEGKILMYDSNGTEVGETYSRRARQLVKQQRAVWADDTHTAIRFAPDTTEDWETASPHPAPHHTPHSPDKGSVLYALAEKRVRDRRQLIWYTVALIPVFVIILIWGAWSYNAARNGGFFLICMGFAWGAWAMAYVSRLRNYFTMSGYNLLSSNRETRYKMALDMEVDRLRRMGYSE